MTRTLAVVVGLVLCVGLRADDSKPKADPRPPFERLLSGEDAKKAEELSGRVKAAEAADKYDDAVRAAEEVLALRTRAQGADHWQVTNAGDRVNALRKVAALPADQRTGWRAAAAAYDRADNVQTPGELKEVEAQLTDYCRRCEQVFGPTDREVAAGSTKLAENRHAQGRLADARALYTKAYAIYRERLGDLHPDTIGAASNLAIVLSMSGDHKAAHPMMQRALEDHRSVLGPRDKGVPVLLNSLAMSLLAQGRYADAQPVFEEAAPMARELFGERHIDTVTNFNNLALNLTYLGRSAEAQPIYRRTLEVQTSMFGEEHPETARTTNNLALNLFKQGKFADAELLYRRALAVYLRLHGERHPDTARTRSNLALVLDDLERPDEARAELEKSLAAKRQVFGDDHPSTAITHVALGSTLMGLKRFDEADGHFQAALKTFRATLGDNHPQVGITRGNLALNQSMQGKHAAAEPHYRAALDLLATGGDQTPVAVTALSNLASNLLAQGKPEDARRLLERSVVGYEAARLVVAGTGLDRAAFGADKSPYASVAAVRARLDDPVAAWGAAEADLARGLSDEAAARRGATLTAAERRDRDALTADLGPLQARIAALVARSKLTAAEREQLAKLQAERHKCQDRLGVLAAGVSRREVATLDEVRAALPADAALVYWVDVSTSEVDGHWGCVVRPTGQPAWVRLPGHEPDGRWVLRQEIELKSAFIRALTNGQPAGTLADRLRDQRIAPLEKYLAGVKRLFVVPVNGMAGIPVEALTDNYTVSYVPSGTFLARLKDRARPTGDRLLAVGDPTFLPPTKTPAPKALAAKSKTDTALASLRGGDWQELPGTRVEVERLKGLLGERAVVLAGSDASEAKVDGLRAAGTLKDFRYLHFATHGEGNDVRAFESSLVLAQDKLTKDPLPRAGQPFLDGKLAASEVLEFWKLDADLVTLSACETAIGRAGGGDGLLGFAQAFLVAGARSVCLTLWKVDDTATCLLMDRFYRNLLGKREDGAKPMGKAAALHEAKRWLKGLSRAEAEARLGTLTQGVVRGPTAARPELPAVPKAPDDRPYAHPRFWAAFVLIGDPD